MNLHKLRKHKYDRNTAIIGLDWMHSGMVLIVDENHLCRDIERNRPNADCYADAGLRGHGTTCLRRAEGVAEFERTDDIGDGLYGCECRCHTEEEVAVYGTYRTQATGTIGNSMYGRVTNPNDQYLDPGDRDMNMYWCYPCRQSDHHWTE